MKYEITITKRQKQILQAIYNSLKNEGYPPTFGDLKTKLDISSNQAIIDHLKALERKKLIKREEGTARGIKITENGFATLNIQPIIPHLGASYTSTMTATFPITDNWQTLSDEVKIKQDMFLVEISGDSMIEAGIDNGDILVAQRSAEFTNKDIVVAQMHDGTTVKRFMLQNHSPRKFLKPENKKYDIILFKTDTKMQARIIGKYINKNILPINPKTKSFI